VDAINKGGASRYLSKPWDDDLLRRTVLEGLEQYRLVQENRRLTALVEQKNAELAEWNSSLKGRLLEQTATIRRQNEELKANNQQIGQAFGNCILAFSRLIALHSSRLQEHTDNVTELSTRVAEALGLAPELKETIRKAALLHEIGAIGIPLELLDKPDVARSREERLSFLQHAVRGQAALEGVEELREAGILIRHHHEHFDGTGFPDALGGKKIPLGARIIACADFIDHQMEQESGANAVEAAVQQATRELGRQLDPELFALMVPHLPALYSHKARPQAGQQAEPEKELRPLQLLPGMIITRDLYCATGGCILTKGTVLDALKIATVKDYYHVDPPRCGIHVSWSTDQPGMRAASLERDNAAKKRANPLAEAFREGSSRR
jgi:response regulator RpfG family c-di-GMP phosphodiesterase